VIDHHTLGYAVFILMNLTMLSGALIFLEKRRNRLWIALHIILAVVTYLLMVFLIWLVR